MQLSEHFADTELGVAGQSPQIVTNAMQLCAILLEPIRIQFGPLRITSGYRNVMHNAATGGESDSQHLYEGRNSAADFHPMIAGLQTVFDWIRLKSHLPFDQVILEYQENLPACIHISYNGALPKQRRMALIGETHGTGAYQSAAVNP